MNGIPEQFIQGSNGRDPEIPYLRYFSNGQPIDFFNKKYFSNGPSGDIQFRSSENTDETKEYQKPFVVENGNPDNNIFRPPFINAMVEDILQRQYLFAFGAKSAPFFFQPDRRRGRPQLNNFLSGMQRHFSPKNTTREFHKNDKPSKESSLSDQMTEEEWTLSDGTDGHSTKAGNGSTGADQARSDKFAMDDSETFISGEYKLPKYSKDDMFEDIGYLNNNDVQNHEIDSKHSPEQNGLDTSNAGQNEIHVNGETTASKTVLSLESLSLQDANETCWQIFEDPLFVKKMDEFCDGIQEGQAELDRQNGEDQSK